jgi:hypothetical protein
VSVEQKAVDRMVMDKLVSALAGHRIPGAEISAWAQSSHALRILVRVTMGDRVFGVDRSVTTICLWSSVLSGCVLEETVEQMAYELRRPCLNYADELESDGRIDEAHIWRLCCPDYRARKLRGEA